MTIWLKKWSIVLAAVAVLGPGAINAFLTPEPPKEEAELVMPSLGEALQALRELLLPYPR